MLVHARLLNLVRLFVRLTVAAPRAEVSRPSFAYVWPMSSLFLAAGRSVDPQERCGDIITKAREEFIVHTLLLRSISSAACAGLAPCFTLIPLLPKCWRRALKALPASNPEPPLRRLLASFTILTVIR
jgi:hypothetical protein